MNTIIETKRLLLREILESDAQDLFELDADPEVHKYLGNKPVKTMDETVNMIKHIHRQYRELGIGRWAVIEKNSNEFVGWSGLKYETSFRNEFPYYDLGYRLKKKFWGKGIATETARECITYGFEKLGLIELFAAAQIANEASNKILQKVGFQCLETFDYDGAPCYWYRLKKSDWQHTLTFPGAK